jgi:outer membrane protein TolC
MAGSSPPKSYGISGSAGVDDLVVAALAHHPSLLATRSRITALEQSAVQKRALPDPSASVSTGSMAETAAGTVLGSVGVQQRIPYPGKRGTAAVVALRQADAMRAQLSSDELALAERVRSAYWDYYAANRTISVITGSKAPLATLRNSIEARIATNKARQQDLLRVENEITRLDQRLATARGRRDSAAASLNALLFRPGGSLLPPPRTGSMRHYSSPATLLARAGRSHPEVRAAEARIAAADAGVRLARLKKKPDFTAGVSYSAISSSGLAPSANGRDQFMGTLGVTLPVWRQKNAAAEREAAATLSAEQSTLSSTRASLQQRIESAHAGYAAERTSVALYAGKLIPDAQQSFELSVAGYQSDSASFLDVIDAWRQLLNFRLEHEENRSRAGKAEAALRFAAGLP